MYSSHMMILVNSLTLPTYEQYIRQHIRTFYSLCFENAQNSVFVDVEARQFYSVL